MKEKWKTWLAGRPDFLWAALIFVLAFVQYANTLGHKYVWDDDIVIVYNKRVQQGFSSIPGHFAFRAREDFADFTGYRPVTMTSFSIDIGLFGMNPQAGHAVNVLLFALLCVVLFRTLRHLFPNFHAAFAFFVALLFVVHPLHVEAVANIKSRDEILSLLFALLSLQYFVKHYRSGRWGQFGWSALFLLLGALSKEGALTFFAVIPMTVVVLLEGNARQKLIGLLKFPVLLLAIVGVFFLLTGKPPGASTPVKTKAYVESQTLGNCMAVKMDDTWQRIGNITFLYGKNLGKFFYPKDLVYFSGYNMHPVKDWTRDRVPMTIPWSVAILMLVFTAVFWRRLKPIVFGYWWFVSTVVIYLQLPFLLLADTLADRFMFMPSVGLCIVVVYALYRLLQLDPEENPLAMWGKHAPKLPAAKRGKAMAFSLGLLGLSVLLSGMSFRRNMVWKDNLTLFSHDLPLLQNCARAHYYYASELVKHYNDSKDKPKAKQEIITHYKRAIEITPESYYAYVRLAMQYQNWKDYGAQAVVCDSALKYYPGQADIWHYKGMAEYYLTHYADASEALKQAVLLAPELDDNWEFLARAQERGGAYDAAFKTLEEALQRNSSYTFYYDVLSDTYFDSGDTAAAFPPILKLLEIDGANPVWWRKLIGRYQMIGDNERASYYYQQAQAKGIALQ